MSGADVSAVAVAAALVAVMVGLAVLVRRKSPPGDAVTTDVVAGLMAELRKWQAESAYWKSQAERLQRELEDPADRDH